MPEMGTSWGIPPTKMVQNLANLTIVEINMGCNTCVLGIYTNLGKLQYFTNLNSSAIEGDDSPKINHDFQWGEDSEVVIIYPDEYTWIYNVYNGYKPVAASSLRLPSAFFSKLNLGRFYDSKNVRF